METENDGDGFPLRYCAGGRETIARLRRLCEDRDPAIVCAVFESPTKALAEFERQHPAGFCEYPDPGERIAFWDAHLNELSAVVDDRVPSACLTEMDQGLYGGMLGAEARFLSDPATGSISSMVPPMFENVADTWKKVSGTFFRNKRYLTPFSSPWFRRYLNQMDVFVRGAAGRFGISHFILIDSLNFVFECVGATKTYLALIDKPDEVRRLIDFAFDLNVAVHEAFFERVGLVQGGTCSTMVGWVRGRVVNESVDPFHMTSVDDFERWGREPVERIFRHFDGGVLHIHGNGRHLLQAVSSIPGLRAIYLGDDKGYPPAITVLPELRQRVGDVPLIMHASFPGFVAALDAHTLVGGCQYIVTGAPDFDAANRTMDRVRAYQL